jgi:hypothetical protein
MLGNFDFVRYWLPLGAAATITLTFFYVGYFGEIGYAFIGLTSSGDLFYNVAGAIGVAIFFLILLQISMTIISRAKNSRQSAFFYVIFTPALIIGIILMTLGGYYGRNLIFQFGWFFIFLFFAIAMIWYVIEQWPATSVGDYALMLSAAIVLCFLFEQSGKLYALYQMNNGALFDIKTQHDYLSRVRVLRSGPLGVVYFMDGKVNFVALSQVISIQRKDATDTR